MTISGCPPGKRQIGSDRWRRQFGREMPSGKLSRRGDAPPRTPPRSAAAPPLSLCVRSRLLLVLRHAVVQVGHFWRVNDLGDLELDGTVDVVEQPDAGAEHDRNEVQVQFV